MSMEHIIRVVLAVTKSCACYILARLFIVTGECDLGSCGDIWIYHQSPGSWLALPAPW